NSSAITNFVIINTFKQIGQINAKSQKTNFIQVHRNLYTHKTTEKRYSPELRIILNLLPLHRVAIFLFRKLLIPRFVLNSSDMIQIVPSFTYTQWVIIFIFFIDFRKRIIMQID